MELLWHLEEEHDSASLELRQLFDGLLAVEQVLHRVVLHPGNEEAAGGIAILLLHHLTKIVQVVLVVDSEPDLVVLVSGVLLVLKEVALDVLVFCVWNWQRNHEEGVEGDGDALAEGALEG